MYHVQGTGFIVIVIWLYSVPHSTQYMYYIVLDILAAQQSKSFQIRQSLLNLKFQFIQLKIKTEIN